MTKEANEWYLNCWRNVADQFRIAMNDIDKTKMELVKTKDNVSFPARHHYIEVSDRSEKYGMRFDFNATMLTREEKYLQMDQYHWFMTTLCGGFEMTDFGGEKIKCICSHGIKYTDFNLREMSTAINVLICDLNRKCSYELGIPYTPILIWTNPKEAAEKMSASICKMTAFIQRGMIKHLSDITDLPDKMPIEDYSDELLEILHEDLADILDDDAELPPDKVDEVFYPFCIDMTVDDNTYDVWWGRCEKLYQSIDLYEIPIALPLSADLLFHLHNDYTIECYGARFALMTRTWDMIHSVMNHRLPLGVSNMTAKGLDWEEKFKEILRFEYNELERIVRYVYRKVFFDDWNHLYSTDAFDEEAPEYFTKKEEDEENDE